MNRMGAALPPITKNLLIINCLMWLATMVLGSKGIVDLEHYLGLHFWRSGDFNAAQLISYMFMHDTSTFQGGLMHLFFNMFSLWMFGSVIERAFGANRFLFYYLSCGLGAAFVQEITWELTWENTFVTTFANQNALSFDTVRMLMSTGQIDNFVNDFYGFFVTVGASGAVFGILLAFGMLFPNLQMFIIPFPFPIKAKWVVIGYGAIELFCGVTNRMEGVAHWAHLGGMLVGLLLILYWRKSVNKGDYGNN